VCVHHTLYEKIAKYYRTLFCLMFFLLYCGDSCVCVCRRCRRRYTIENW